MSVVKITGGVLALYGYLFPLPMYGDVSNQLAEIVSDVSILLMPEMFITETCGN